jgi:enterochelin esterase-like enzyme
MKHNAEVNQPYLRTLELSCNSSFTQFLVAELLPWVRQRYQVTRNPANTAVGGASRGGLAAACAALDHPEIFGNLFSQSRFFVYKDKNWLGELARMWRRMMPLKRKKDGRSTGMLLLNLSRNPQEQYGSTWRQVFSKTLITHQFS